MRPAALLSSFFVLLLLISVVVIRPLSEREEKADSETGVVSDPPPSASRRDRVQALAERLRPRQLEVGNTYLRPRTREVLNAGGLVNYASGPGEVSAAEDSWESVIRWMRERDSEKGYTLNDFDDVVLNSQSVSRHNGITHLYFRQRIGGIEVYNGDASANVGPNGTILSLHNRFVRDLDSEINIRDPQIDAVKAIQLAAADLGVVRSDEMLAVRQMAKGPEQAMVFEGGGISQDPIPAKLMYLPQAEETTRLVWNAVIHLPDSARWMDVNIDAESGDILSRSNWYAHANYRVFPFPNETPLDGGRQLVVGPEDASASPFGWHDTDGISGAEFSDTRGNNVNAQDDTDANNSGGGRPEGGVTLNFDNPLDLTEEPSTYLDGAITNLFYWNNILHDIHYQYGFDEAAGNFQENNYGNGGAGSDPVEADAQDGSGTNNANFGTPPDGSNPRMQMFVWTNTTPNRDSDLDNVIIIHEYGHGVSNRLTGGAANSSALSASQSRGMGEGWSDWWGLALTAKPGQPSDLSRSVGHYVLGQPATGSGIRPRPYTTDLSVNEYTYGDLPSGLSVPHGIGFVWCSILWEMYWKLVDFHGFDSDIYQGSGGNNIALQLVMDGLKLQPATPTYLEARDAILLADQVNNGGVNSDLIWQAFAKRGMGFSASDSGDPNSLTVTEAFDLPDEQFSINDVTVTEGDSGTTDAVFTVTLSAEAAEVTSVDYTTFDATASAPADFTGVSGTLSFATGEVSKTITVPVIGETDVEDDEAFSVVLSSPFNAIILDGEGIGTILTDEFAPPVISSPLTAQGIAGRNFLYQITAQNVPRSFALGGTVPPGMTIDTTTGVINWTPSISESVSVSISATNPAGTNTKTLVIEVSDDPIKDALDTGLPIQNGNPPWFLQAEVTLDGVDAAQSGAIDDSEATWFELTVDGPDTLRFWWKVSSELGFDYLRLKDDGTTVAQISGEQDWEASAYTVPAGTHLIRWSYEKDMSVVNGSDASWVDLISLDSEDLRPVIISRALVTGIKEKLFSHQIETTHSAASFSIAGALPAGLSLDTATGILSGTPTEVGTFTVTIGATNTTGTAEQILTVEIQDPVGMSSALDTGLTITSGPIPWFIQTEMTYDGVDAAQSGDVDDGESTWFEIPIAGPDTLTFWWKVSSESGIDVLRLLDDGVEVRSVSGEEDWREVNYEVAAGVHTMRWVYEKDPVISVGSDTAWVDQIVLATTGQLSDAIDNSSVDPFTSDPQWFRQTTTTFDGVDAAQSGNASDEEITFLDFSVEGPDTIAFQWKVSSEANYDYLRFKVDGTEIAAIAGEVGWERVVHELPSGTHALRWEFDKDQYVSAGSDAGWLDDVALLSSDFRPFITSASEVFGKVGVPFFYQIQTSQPATSFSSGTLSAGLSLNTSTGLISGTPTGFSTTNVSVTATNASGSDTQAVSIVISNLGEALDMELPVSTGSPSWFYETTTTHDGVDAAQSGDVNDGEISYFDFDVVGPDTVNFWWKVSSEAGIDGLIFSLDGTAITSITGEIDWTQYSYAIPEGNHSLRWEYFKNGQLSVGSDSGWVDEISFQSIPLPQVITFPAIPNQALSNTFALSATGGGSGNPVTFAITSGPATIDSSNILRFTGSGTVTVAASQAGSQRHVPAENVSRTFTVATAQILFDGVATAAGLGGSDALPSATPYGGSVTNLEKYAYNMELDSLDLRTMVDGGSSGLPLLQTEVGDTPCWTLQYIRRKGSGLAYTPKTSTTLVSGSFVAVSEAGTVVSIDEDWERVEICAPMPDGPLFVIVEVSVP
ncbi:MAG: hypothetical protein CMO61_09800 [Verrucomicrobiales bacterium]|nr:hypothetical protein [Verrucomicrobiales bacterium]